MSGTSLDGLDIACCTFTGEGNAWKFSIADAETIDYSDTWRKKLEGAHKLSAIELLKLHNEYGAYLGKCVYDFVKKKKVRNIDFASSHGHTIFHQPEQRFTFQLGSGASMAAICMLPVVNDFRSLDMALSGQGAPLVPIGDKLLFGEYNYCLNLGGFANISFDKKGKRIAFDICPVNIVLNHLANRVGKEYDKNGAMAAKGKINKPLLEKLNKLEFYKKPPPKSLGREWVESYFLPILNKSTSSVEDKLATVAQHVAVQISKCVGSKGSLLVTGGGAFNNYMIKQLKANMPGISVVIPAEEIVKYKEALVFAFLGVLRWEGKNNCLASVTGAKADNSGGSVFLV